MRRSTFRKIAFGMCISGGLFSIKPSLSAEPSDDGAVAMQFLLESHGVGRVVLLHDRRGKWGNFVHQANKYLVDTDKIAMMMAVDIGLGGDMNIATLVLERSPDLVVCVCFDDDAAKIVRNLRSSGYTGVFVGTSMLPL